jgi:hypothetical protein
MIHPVWITPLPGLDIHRVIGTIISAIEDMGAVSISAKLARLYPVWGAASSNVGNNIRVNCLLVRTGKGCATQSTTPGITSIAGCIVSVSQNNPVGSASRYKGSPIPYLPCVVVLVQHHSEQGLIEGLAEGDTEADADPQKAKCHGNSVSHHFTAK